MPPTVILIRHAQALHNVAHNLHDPELSELGRDQCKELRQNLQEKLPKELDVGLILVSPMRRTIETALRSLDWLIEKGIPIQAHAGWQETSAKPCDTGSSIDALKAEFPQIDYSQLDPVYPDKTSPAGSKYAYNKKALVARAQSSLADLYSRPEKAIIVVSHSGFLRQCVTGNWYFNADYRIYDFEERTSSDEPYKLKQWELTDKGHGGMGWSWDELVTIGEGLPEEALPPTKETPNQSLLIDLD